HQSLVGPLEIERVNERFAQSLILELVAAGIEETAPRARRRIVGGGGAPDAAPPGRRENGGGGPRSRGKFLAEEIALAGEAFEGDIAVAIKFVADDVEIVLSAPDREVGAPPILDPFVFDVAAGVETPHLVGAAAERRLERRLVEGMLGVV